MTTTLYVARRFGRLANRLVLSAHLAAFAREHGLRLVNYTLHSYASEFANLRSDLGCSFPPRRGISSMLPGFGSVVRKTRLCYHLVRTAAHVAPRLPVVGAGVVTLDDELTDLADDSGIIPLEDQRIADLFTSRRRVFVNGWQFRAPELVVHHADEIREYLRPAYKHFKAAHAVVGPLRDAVDVVVGVHLRRGDYRTWLGGRYFFDDAAYNMWMSQVARQYPRQRVAFLICSDEPIQRSSYSPHRVATGPGSPLGDMTALSMCDLILGPVSTYSQWASFAGDTPLLTVTHERQAADRHAAQVSRMDVLPGITPDARIPSAAA